MGRCFLSIHKAVTFLDNNTQLTSLWLKLLRNGLLESMWARAMRDYIVEMGTVSKLRPIAYINQ